MDVPITPRGLEQAKKAGGELRESSIIIDKIISSPLSRAFDTAVQVAKEIRYPIDRIALDSRLRERNMGRLQGMPVASVQLLDTMSAAEQEAAGIETEAMLEERAQRILQKLSAEADGQSILVVSHNGFGRRLVALSQGVSFHKVAKLPNGRVVRIDDEGLLLKD